MSLTATATRELPHTQAQLRKLWTEAKQRGWHADQVYGRATELHPDVDVVGLRVLTITQMSDLIEAVMMEPVWVDPRQTRPPL